LPGVQTAFQMEKEVGKELQYVKLCSERYRREKNS